MPSEKVDKLGVLRPLSLPWVGLGGKGAHGEEGERRRNRAEK